MGAIKREYKNKRRQRATQAEGRNPERIKLIFADIKVALEKVAYHLQSDYPGLVEEERAYMISVKEQVASLTTQADMLGQAADK